MSSRIFISHISGEAGVAARLKAALTNDFLGLVEVFVSSDTESIAAGEEWLTSMSRALRESSVFLVEPGRNNPSLYAVNGRPVYVHFNGLAIVRLK